MGEGKARARFRHEEPSVPEHAVGATLSPQLIHRDQGASELGDTPHVSEEEVARAALSVASHHREVADHASGDVDAVDACDEIEARATVNQVRLAVVHMPSAAAVYDELKRGHSRSP